MVLPDFSKIDHISSTAMKIRKICDAFFRNIAGLKAKKFVQQFRKTASSNSNWKVRARMQSVPDVLRNLIKYEQYGMKLFKEMTDQPPSKAVL